MTALSKIARFSILAVVVLASTRALSTIPTEGRQRWDPHAEFVVTAVNEAGESPNSNPASLDKPSYPGVPEPVDPGQPVKLNPPKPVYTQKPAYGPYDSYILDYGTDAYVSKRDPDKNFGVEPTLDIQTIPWMQSEAYIRFDLDRDRIKQPNIQSAILHVYCTSLASCGSYIGPVDVTLYGVEDDAWKETAITWNTKPEGVPLSTQTISERDKWYTFDVTDFVQKQYAADKKVSFKLASDTEQHMLVSFGAKEEPPKSTAQPLTRPILKIEAK